MEILREKITTDKKFLVATNMNLTDAEAKKFWPIYKSYQKDLHQINERLGKVIDDTVTKFRPLSWSTRSERYQLRKDSA